MWFEPLTVSGLWTARKERVAAVAKEQEAVRTTRLRSIGSTAATGWQRTAEFLSCNCALQHFGGYNAAHALTVGTVFLRQARHAAE